MTQFNHGAFMAKLRELRGKVPADLYADLVPALEAGIAGADRVLASRPGEPVWLAEARQHIGVKEIPGKTHNPTILGWVKQLGGWFTDDETPWCGTFVAACMVANKHPVPKHWYRAKDWADWGKPTPPRVGAVAVFGRTGGGHVGFVVGESADNLYVLGGNQSNMVNIAPIAKSRLIALRWPSAAALSSVKLAAMHGGAISRNEA